MVTGTVETVWLEGLVEGYFESLWGGVSRDGRSLGFHDWMMDCAEAADFVISFTGDSVAIDRVNCLLNAVVAGYFAKGQPLVISKTFRLSLSTHLGRRYPQRSHGLAEAPNSLSSHSRQRLCAMPGCRSRS